MRQKRRGDTFGITNRWKIVKKNCTIISIHKKLQQCMGQQNPFCKGSMKYCAKLELVKKAVGRVSWRYSEHTAHGDEKAKSLFALEKNVTFSCFDFHLM